MTSRAWSGPTYDPSIVWAGKQCLEEIARGKRVEGVAERLKIAPVTVEMHLRNVRFKLGASTNPEAVAKAIMLGAINI